MKRLIDAESLKSCYEGHNGLDDKASYKSIRKMIDIQPTVCDLDEIVKELEREKDLAWQDTDDDDCEKRAKSWGKIHAFHRAIEIVKGLKVRPYETD